MEISSIEGILSYLKNHKRFLYERFGVTRIGIFGSFTLEEQTSSSDIDMVVEIEKNRKNIHSFLEMKRFLEKELARKIDMGFEHSLKPVIRDKIKGQIIYV
ncbi:MAG: nucleotidyltransferase domain-containing protein [Nitrospirae bacterium]|nr:nucleotidyltransferase domain-containing protein [Nitrospirota bacterium]